MWSAAASASRNVMLRSPWVAARAPGRRTAASARTSPMSSGTPRPGSGARRGTAGPPPEERAVPQGHPAAIAPGGDARRGPSGGVQAGDRLTVDVEHLPVDVGVETTEGERAERPARELDGSQRRLQGTQPTRRLFEQRVLSRLGVGVVEVDRGLEHAGGQAELPTELGRVLTDPARLVEPTDRGEAV